MNKLLILISLLICTFFVYSNDSRFGAVLGPQVGDCYELKEGQVFQVTDIKHFGMTGNGINIQGVRFQRYLSFDALKLSKIGQVDCEVFFPSIGMVPKIVIPGVK